MAAAEEEVSASMRCALFDQCRRASKRGRDPFGVYPHNSLCNSCRCKRRREFLRDAPDASEAAAETRERPAKIRTRSSAKSPEVRRAAGVTSKAASGTASSSTSPAKADSSTAAATPSAMVQPQASLRPVCALAEITPSEVYKAELAFSFSASHHHSKGWAYAWVHRRGRLDAASGDGGLDLVLMDQGACPRVLLSGARSLSPAVWAPDGDGFVVQCEKELVHISLQGGAASVASWLQLPADEDFVGSPVWTGAAGVLFATSGGSPRRHRLFATRDLPPATADGAAKAEPSFTRSLIFEAEKGGELMSWDQSPVHPMVAVVHRFANAALAQVVLVDAPPPVPASATSAPDQVSTWAGSTQRVVAIDGRVEYCKPQLAFLADGRLVARLNLAAGPPSDIDISAAKPPPATHGLWLLDVTATSKLEWEPIQVRPDLPHGSYDVFSGSYGGGVPGEGFVLDASRQKVVAAVRRHSFETVADELWLVQLSGLESGKHSSQHVELPPDSAHKGCHVPVALSGSALVYHFRSPTEWGDLWVADLSSEEGPCSTARLTHTMPDSLRRKLSTPSEVTVSSGASGCHAFHALLFRPKSASSGRLQPLVWVHGGPSSMYAYDYNPLLNWLAELGYLVCVPNFRGSVGFGIDFMDAVLADGCGVVDYQDCVACAHYLRGLAKEDPQLDLRRGVGVAGHSWGGYLALLCMVRGGSEGYGAQDVRPFSCGVASAAIADFAVQQRGTEVRYFDYALMGGWVYEPGVAARAAQASPTTFAACLGGPLLVLHGEDDRDVPFEQIGPFVEAAKRSTHPLASVKYVTYPGCGHSVRAWNCVAQSDSLRQMRDFLRVNLKPWDFTDNPHGDLTTY